MKRYLLTLIAAVFPLVANAQMNEMMGVLAIDGMMDREAYQGMGQMQNALNRVNFQQELSDLITETQIAALNGYFDKSSIHFYGLKDVDWDVTAVATGQYYIELKNLDDSTCLSMQNGQWGTHHIEVNDGGECNKGVNNVKLFF